MTYDDDGRKIYIYSLLATYGKKAVYNTADKR